MHPQPNVVPWTLTEPTFLPARYLRMDLVEIILKRSYARLKISYVIQLPYA